MKKNRSVLEVKINLDSIPGWGNKPEDHTEWLQKLLDKYIPHYHPEVKLIRTEESEN